MNSQYWQERVAELEEDNKALSKELEHANYEISVLQEEIDNFEDRYQEGYDEGYSEGIDKCIDRLEDIR